MRTRRANPGDFARLKEIHKQSGLEFPLPDMDSAMIEGIEVVEDDRGEIMMAAIGHKAVEITLIAPAGQLHPVVKMEGIKLLHSSLRDTIASKGYTEYFSFVEPSVEKSFGRHLKRWFGWEKCWQAYRLKDWKGEPSA